MSVKGFDLSRAVPVTESTGTAKPSFDLSRAVRVEPTTMDNVVASTAKIAPFVSKLVRGAVPSAETQAQAPVQAVKGQFDIANRVFKSGGYQKSLPDVGQVVGETIGAVVGNAPGAVVGAGFGQALGKAGEQYFDAVEGKKQKPLSKQYIEQAGAGAEGAYTAMLGQGVAKGAEKIAQAYPMAKDFFKFPKNIRQGFNNFVEQLDTVLSPKGKLVRNELLDKFGSKPASNISEAKDFIEKKLGEKGLVQPVAKQGISGATSGRMKVSPDVLQKALQETGQSQEALAIQNLTTEVKGGKLGATKPYIKPTKYQNMSDVLEGLNNPNATYKDLLDMKKSAGDNANFGAKDFDRTQEQKEYGELYHALDNDLARTAKEGKFAYAHDRIHVEGQAYNRKKFLKDLLETNKTDKPGAKGTRYYSPGEQANIPAVAYGVMDYTDDQLGRVFGMTTNDIKTLRQLSAHIASRTSGKNELEEMGRMYISGGGKPGAVIHPVKWMTNRLGVEKSIDQILTDRGFEGAEKTMLKNILYGNMKSKPVESVSGLGKELDRVLGNATVQSALNSMGKNK